MSLVLIPQTLISFKIELSFIEIIETWGFFANLLFNLHKVSYVSYILTFTGILIYFFHKIFLVFLNFKVKNK